MSLGGKGVGCYDAAVTLLAAMEPSDAPGGLQVVPQSVSSPRGEMAYATDLKSVDRKVVPVRVRPGALGKC